MMSFIKMVQNLSKFPWVLWKLKSVKIKSNQIKLWKRNTFLNCSNCCPKSEKMFSICYNSHSSEVNQTLSKQFIQIMQSHLLWEILHSWVLAIFISFGKNLINFPENHCQKILLMFDNMKKLTKNNLHKSYFFTLQWIGQYCFKVLLVSEIWYS